MMVQASSLYPDCSCRTPVALVITPDNQGRVRCLHCGKLGGRFATPKLSDPLRDDITITHYEGDRCPGGHKGEV